MTDHSDHQVAARLATEAGRLLLDVRTELADATEAERKAAGDKRSHEFLMEALAAERPGDAVLSEEGADNPVRLTAERVWIVDPLDGTREFSELGREDWAVHVALWQSDAPPDAHVWLGERGWSVEQYDAVERGAAYGLEVPAARQEHAGDRARLVDATRF